MTEEQYAIYVCSRCKGTGQHRRMFWRWRNEMWPCPKCSGLGFALAENQEDMNG